MKILLLLLISTSAFGSPRSWNFFAATSSFWNLFLPQVRIPGPGGAVPSGSTGASDNFNRADGAIGSNWTLQDGTLTISSNAVVVASGFNIAFINTGSFNNDQSGQIDLVNAPPSWGNLNSAVEIHVRMSSTGATQNHYGFVLKGNDSTEFYKTVSGVDTTLTCTGCTTVTALAGDTLKISIVGSSLTGQVIRSGTPILTATATDSSLTTGRPGFAIYLSSGGTPSIDNFVGQ